MMAIASWFSVSRVTAPILCVLALTGCSMFGVRSGYEQAPYTVIDRIGESTEVRRYPPQVVAEAIVEAPDASSGRHKAFRALFDYISGANRSQANTCVDRLAIAVERKCGRHALVRLALCHKVGAKRKNRRGTGRHACSPA
jgi:SOUL heme-binding protein